MRTLSSISRKEKALAYFWSNILENRDRKCQKRIGNDSSGVGVAWREEGTEERDTGKGGGQGQHRDQVVETVRHGDPIAVLIKSGSGKRQEFWV